VLFEIALVSILIPTAYWGVLYVRRRPFGSATAGWMLLATAGLAGFALIGRRAGLGGADVLGAIALGTGTVQLLIAPTVRAAARWAVASDRLRLAAVLVDLRDLLQPGMGGGEDKRVVAALRDVKEGRVDHAIDALESLRGRAPEAARPAIDERIVLLLLSAQRWRDAVAHAERTLTPRAPAGPGRLELIAGELGVSPPVFVELVAARLRVGDLDGGAAAAERFAAAAAGTPELGLLLYRLHLVVLAHVGRVDAVDRMLEPRNASYVTPAARRYWAGVARHAAGDTDGARTCYEEARARAGRDRRARQLVADGLATLDRALPAPTPRALAVADDFARAPVTLPPRTPSRRALATPLLIGANLVVAALCALLLGGVGDLGAIVRAGANVRGGVDAGEWWRLPSSVFVHVGWVHLGVNLLALWSLGRLVEGLFGSARAVVIYGLAGLAGAVASHYLSEAGVSAGASGAIFGLLGAALSELALHRKRYRKEWRRSLLGALVIVTVAQLGVGMGWSMVDQWAHVGGLVTGLALGALLSPAWRWSERRAAEVSARVLAVALIAVYLGAGAFAAVTPYRDRLRDTPRVTRAIGGVQVTLPDDWAIDADVAQDLDLRILLALDALSPFVTDTADLDKRLDAAEPIERERAAQSHFTEVQPGGEPRIPLPAGWVGRERVLVARDALGNLQRERLILFAGDPGGVRMVGALYVPDLLADDAGALLGEILATVRPAP
jgi:membrane associated rhomboid family serine protease